jgi:hypothetical protein
MNGKCALAIVSRLLPVAWHQQLFTNPAFECRARFGLVRVYLAVSAFGWLDSPDEDYLVGVLDGEEVTIMIGDPIGAIAEFQVLGILYLAGFASEYGLVFYVALAGQFSNLPALRAWEFLRR